MYPSSWLPAVNMGCFGVLRMHVPSPQVKGRSLPVQCSLLIQVAFFYLVSSYILKKCPHCIILHGCQKYKQMEKALAVKNWFGFICACVCVDLACFS